MLRKISLSLANALLIFLMSWGIAYAAPIIPDFPACSNPSGSIKAQYNTGNHGIAGSSQTFSGSDVVYQVSDKTLTQCFCSDNGNGTQTNWWKVSSLSQSDIDTLTNLGWIFVANGADWGLTNDPYMAFNSTYSCKSNGQTNSTSTSNSGSVASASTSSGGSVLGLATTGDTAYLLSLFLVGSLLLFVGIILRRAK